MRWRAIGRLLIPECAGKGADLALISGSERPHLRRASEYGQAASACSVVENRKERVALEAITDRRWAPVQRRPGRADARHEPGVVDE
jgi:hypothetical protein